MSVEYWSNQLNKIPSLYSFINFRRENNGGFIFNPYLYTEIWVDELEYKIIEKIDGTYLLSDIINYIANLINSNQIEANNIVKNTFQKLISYNAIFFTNEPKPLKTSTLIKNNKVNKLDYYSAPLSVLWDITYRCNMKCKHCLNGDPTSFNELNLSEIMVVLNELKRMKVFSINFSGGEPLIRDDIFEILQAASKQNFGLRLSSNGLLIDNTILERLKDLDVFCLQISIDGFKETHDNFRGVKGAYEKAINALKTASEMGFHTTMSTMIIKDNVGELEGLLELAESLGVSSFKLNSFMPMGRGDTHQDNLKVSKNNLEKLSAIFLKKKNEHGHRINMQIDALFPWLLNCNIKDDIVVRGITSSVNVKCSAGQTTLVISPEGTVFSCPFLSQFPLGNILESSLYDIWHNDSSILGKFRGLKQEDLSGKCKNCRFVPKYCNGGCRAASIIVNNDFHGEDPFCWKN